VQLVSGGLHNCVLFESGLVKCWGYGSNGRLGYGNANTIGASDTPADVGAVQIGSPVLQLAAGNGHTCALLAGGTLRCWGFNSTGQLGYGDTTDRGDDPGETPDTYGDIQRSDSTALSPVIFVAAGFSATCAIVGDGVSSGGDLYCWGANVRGELGCGACGELHEPSAMPVALPEPATSVSIGQSHSCAIGESGSLYCWGWDLFGQLGNGPATGNVTAPASPVVADAVAVTAANIHTCAVRAGGALDCWGNNSSGEAGDGTCLSSLPSPYNVVVSGVTGISGGSSHNCALVEPGDVYEGVACWGSGANGRLGYGDPSARCEPLSDAGGLQTVSVEGAGDEVTSVTTGTAHTCVLLARGGVRCWGESMNGQTGHGSIDPIGDDELPASAPDVPLF
jgi:alpha-tubulin suppressor-like RCC1 family protein